MTFPSACCWLNWPRLQWIPLFKYKSSKRTINPHHAIVKYIHFLILKNKQAPHIKYKYNYTNTIYTIIVHLTSFNLNFNSHHSELNCI